MVDPIRFGRTVAWTTAIVAVLLPSCGSQVPDGEVPCEMATAVSCPAHVPVCEQRAADEGAFCYREAQAGVASRRMPARKRPAPPVPASRSYRLIDQSVAKLDGTTLAAPARTEH
jgi:hypothetical protein